MTIDPVTLTSAIVTTCAVGSPVVPLPAAPGRNRLAGASDAAALDDVFEYSQLAVALLDSDGRIVRANRALRDFLGIDVGTLAGRWLSEWVVAADRAKLTEAIASADASGSCKLALRMRTTDDATGWTASTLRRLHGNGLQAALVFEAQDITEWRRSEDEVTQYQQQMLQRDKMASIGQLAAGVAHEINNPLGYVGSNLASTREYLRTLMAALDCVEEAASASPQVSAAAVWERIRAKMDLDYVRDDAMDMLAETIEGVDRVKKIVQDLKEFSHADAQDTWTPADLHRGLDSTLNIVCNEIKYRATVEKAYGNLPQVECLQSQLNQVFMNILINAGQAVGEKGHIRIATGVDGARVWIEIADDGCGIAPEHRARIFEPFFTTKQVGVGTGLGLSLSYSIVQKHGGEIQVDSTPGEGSTFRIWLPICQPPATKESGS